MRSKVQLRWFMAVVLLTATLLLAGCSLLFGGGPSAEATPTADDRVIVPTFTPTTEVPATATPEPTVAEAAVVEVPAENVPESTPAAAPDAAAPAASAPAADAPTPAPVEEAPTPTPIPKLSVTAASANARGGPGTEYGLTGTVTQGQSFDVIGKNADGTWWRFCCVNGQESWIFGELVSTDNADSVPVAQNIPAPPVAQAPAPTQAPAPPVEQPPAEQPPAEQPPAEEPPAEAPPPSGGGAVNAGANCGGDDGCKFRVSGGPSFAQNGGGQMKLQLFFKHSGVDGGQPQGDYRLGVERDGQLIVPFADTTSIALSSNQGSMGRYNYEASVNASDLPGGTLEGTYYFWVLDGNRERDSEVFEMYVPPGQGEIWIEFDQG